MRSTKDPCSHQRSHQACSSQEGSSEKTKCFPGVTQAHKSLPKRPRAARRTAHEPCRAPRRVGRLDRAMGAALAAHAHCSEHARSIPPPGIDPRATRAVSRSSLLLVSPLAADVRPLHRPNTLISSRTPAGLCSSEMSMRMPWLPTAPRCHAEGEDFSVCMVTEEGQSWRARAGEPRPSR